MYVILDIHVFIKYDTRVYTVRSLSIVKKFSWSCLETLTSLPLQRLWKDSQEALMELSGNSQEALRRLSAQESLRKLSGSSQETLRKLSASSQEPLSSRIFQEILRKLSGSSQETLRKLSRDSQEALRKLSGGSLRQSAAPRPWNSSGSHKLMPLSAKMQKVRSFCYFV